MNPLRRIRDSLARLAASRFAPYRAVEDGFDVAAMQRTLLASRQLCGQRGCLDGFADYRALVDGVRNMPDARIVPLRELMQSAPEERRRLTLRCDIDLDPYTAIRMARYNARYGLCGSFFLLHTNYYYGVIRQRVLHRNPLLREWIAALIVAGCEIGLHADPLSLYFEHRIDGADALRQELLWLRAQGARIEGTVAHNSVPLYGAENFEVFRGRTIWQRRLARHHGVRAPLAVLDETALGLAYEGNFAVPVSARPTPAARQWLLAPTTDALDCEDWMRCYLGAVCYRRAYEATVWHHGGGRWTVSAQLPDGRSQWLWKVSMKEMLAALGDFPPGTRTVVTLHAIYFSADAEEPA